MKWILFLLSFFLIAACNSDTTQTTEEVKNENQVPTVSDIFPKEVEPSDSKTAERKIEKDKAIRKGKVPVRINLQEKIEKMHKNLMTQMESGFDIKEIAAYAKESELYMSIYGDSLAAEYIFNAADLYRGVGDYSKALEMWYLVYSAYKQEHPKAPHALFQCGFVYDSVLDRKDLAKNLFLKFLKKYPNHELAGDVKSMLKNLDKSPEDLIKEFKKKNVQ